MVWTPEADADLGPQPAPAKVLPMRARDVIQEDRLVVANQLPTRWSGTLLRWWKQTPAVVKRDAAALVALSGAAEVVSVRFSPFFVFGLGLVVRLFFFLVYALRIEIGRFEAKVAARTLAYINVTALVAITVVLFQTTAIWKYQAYLYLVAALTFEVVSVLTWYTQWAVSSENWNDGAGGLRRVFEPRQWYLLAAFAFLIGEYIAYGIEWCPLLDKIILWTYHAIIWLYHFMFVLFHVLIDIIHVIVYLCDHPILGAIVVIAIIICVIRAL